MWKVADMSLPLVEPLSRQIETPNQQLDEVWRHVQELLRRTVSSSTYAMWFAELAPASLAGDAPTLEVEAPTEYVAGRVAGRYLEVLRVAVRAELGQAAEVAVRVAEESPQDPNVAEVPTPSPDDESNRRAPGSAANDGVPAGTLNGSVPPPEAAATSANRPRGRRAAPAVDPDQVTLAEADRASPGSSFPDRYTFDSFVPGASNKFAHAAAMAVAEAPPSRAYNPLFIYGGVGLGKTHLLFAIANHMMRMAPRTRIRYVTSEAFMTEFIRAVREGRGYLFQRQYRDIDVLLLDDVQFLARAEETQREFFHTFNHLYQREGQIVIASDRPPQELGGIEERLRSRFRSGLVVDVQPPDLETRIAILQLKAARDSLAVPLDVQHFIASKFDSNIRELEGALLRVVAFASLSRQPIDLRLTERALEDLIPESGHEISPALILDETAEYFELTRDDLISKSRSRPLTTARHVAMYLLRELTGLSLIKIGELFERDHTTALHGIKKIEALMPARGSVYRQVQELTKKIRARGRGLAP
jgi:chromosomal replication initiator protein